MAMDYKMGTHAIQLHHPWLCCVCKNSGNEWSAPEGRYGDYDPSYIFLQHSADSHAHSEHIIE